MQLPVPVDVDPRPAVADQLKWNPMITMAHTTSHPPKYTRNHGGNERSPMYRTRMMRPFTAAAAMTTAVSTPAEIPENSATASDRTVMATRPTHALRNAFGVCSITSPSQVQHREDEHPQQVDEVPVDGAALENGAIQWPADADA